MARVVLTSFLLIFILSFSVNDKERIKQFSAIERYPNDSTLFNFSSKRALIVIAHDDDMCGMSGTISKLNRMGWYIGVVSFSKTPERNAAQVKACKNILDTVLFVPLQPREIRNDLDSVSKTYLAFPRSQFERVFNHQKIEEHYLKAIKAVQPSVIFSLDNEIGGYGHPEHVFISQMVLDFAKSGKINVDFVYQSVYTDHMENTIMKRHADRIKSWGFPGDEWDNAKAIYGVSGMPEPSVQINIQSEAKSKMAYLKSYNKRERKVIDFYVPFFEDYNAKDYFSVFDREFFRVIQIKK